MEHFSYEGGCGVIHIEAIKEVLAQARGPQLEKMLYEISNLSILARFQGFGARFQDFIL